MSSGDEYAKFSVYTDADLGLTKDDVDTVTAAMKQIEAKTCIRCRVEAGRLQFKLMEMAQSKGFFLRVYLLYSLD